jgi:hypothetical protein
MKEPEAEAIAKVKQSAVVLCSLLCSVKSELNAFFLSI